MRQGWMAMNRRLEGGERCLPKRCLPELCLLAALALGGASGCSDDPRTPDGEHFPGVEVIDDMEDGTQYILSDDGRIGLWYTYNDASPNGTQEPALGFPMYRTRRPNGAPDPSSQVIARECGAGLFAGEENCSFVARTWGTGQRGWGAGMGVDLNGQGGIKNPFDASAFGGIGFFAIGSIRKTTPPLPQEGQLRVNAQDVRTTPESAAAADRRGIGRCESYLDNGMQTGRCNDHYGVVVNGVGAEWKWFQIPFHCMQSGGWGYPAAPASGGEPNDNVLRRDAIVGIQFQIQGADPEDTGRGMGAVLPFDFSIDNLSFLDQTVVNDTTSCTSFSAN